MTKDICSQSIEALPIEISKDFREYDHWFNTARIPWKVLDKTRTQLARALDAYRHIFEQWKSFYSQIDDRLKLAYKDRASRAIEGMNPGDVTSRVTDLDKRYKTLCQPTPSADVEEQAGRVILALDVTRDQVAELALAYNKSQSDLAAAKTDALKHGEFLKIFGQPRDLQVFLQQNFPQTWQGLSDGRPLVDITMEVIRQLKDGRTVN